MKPYAALVALVLLGGCLGGIGADDAARDGTTIDATETPDGDAETSDAAAETSDTAADAPTTTDAEANATATFEIEDRENPNVTLEVADEPDERESGLMHRESLPEDHGMVFVYDGAATRTFWMKNTLVPLDIIYVGPDGTVLNVEHARTQPDAADSELDRYRSDGDAKYVVELERGFANRTGLGSGDRLVFNGSAPEAGE